MAKPKEHKWYKMSGGKLNRHGYRVKVGNSDTDGIHTDAYLKNPVILYMHNGHKMSVGKMELKKDEGVLYGRPTFDIEDEVGKDLDRKYHKGFMSAFSIKFDPLKLSEEDLVEGQYRPNVDESDLMEISAVNVPGDRDAAALSLSEGQTIDDVLPKLNFQTQKKTMETNKIPNEITNALQLSADANVVDIVNAINVLKSTAQNALSAQVKSIMDLGREKGVITDDNVGRYEKLCAQDPESVKGIIDEAKVTKAEEVTPAGESLSAAIAKTKAANADVSKVDTEKTFEELSKSNPSELKRIKTEEPERYKQLAAEYSKSKSV